MYRKKSVLYITRTFEKNSPIGERSSHMISFLKSHSTLFVINLTNKLLLYKKESVFWGTIYKFLKKIPFIPDVDILILQRYKKAINNSLKINNIDTVIVSVLPYSFMLLAKYIKSINSNIKVIIDLSDPLTLQINYNKTHCLKKKFLSYLEKNSLKYIDTLIVLNKKIKNHYKEKYNYNNVLVVEQGIDNKTITCSKPSTGLTSNKLQLIYAGHLYKNGREPFELYNAISEMNFSIALRIFGNFKSVFIPPKENCFFYGGKISKDILCKEYQKANVIVFIDNKDTFQTPGKLFEILSLNKPILFIYYNINSPSFELIQGFCGVFFTENKSNNIKKTINEIINQGVFHFNRDLKKYYWNNLLNKITDYL